MVYRARLADAGACRFARIAGGSVEFDQSGQLDTSQVDDLRGSSGGGPLGGRVAVGGGGLGIVGLILYFLISQVGGGSLPGGGLSGVPAGSRADNTSLAEKCRTGADASSNLDCEAVAFINSIQAYWSDQFARSGRTYRPAKTNFFNGSVNTACGSASSDVGPFYCPADQEIYIDLNFYQELQQRFGAQGGPFARAYVLAHEYGHHVQNVIGTSDRVRQGDCYAGVWGNHATTTPTSSGRPLVQNVTEADIKAALDTAGRIGDDFIQSQLGGGRVNESQFTHGSSAQREKWFLTGYRTGDPARCDTFSRGVDLG